MSFTGDYAPIEGAKNAQILPENDATEILAAPPPFVGAIIVDDGTVYMSVGTTTAATDWVVVETAVNGIVTPVAAVTPAFIGQIYVDTLLGVTYIAVGTANTDWSRLQNAPASGAGTPTVIGIGAPDFLGQFYVDTAAEKIYFAADVAAESDWVLITSA